MHLKTIALLLPASLILLDGGAALADDAPIALEKWGRYHVNITPYMPNPSPPKGKKVTWVPRVELVFKVTSPESDDIVELQHYKGKRKWGPVQKCSLSTGGNIKRRGKGGKPMGYSLVAPNCLMDKKLAISKTGTFSVSVSYKQTGLGKLHKDLARYTYQVKQFNSVWPGKRPPIKNFYSDHDFRLGEAWLYKNSEGQLQIWSWFKYDSKGAAAVREGRIRCYVDGKKLAFYQNPTRRTENYYQHWPTRKKNERVTWGLWYWWTGTVGDGTGGDFIKKNPGKYRCTLTQAGDISREFFFEVAADGTIAPAPCQQGDSPDRVRSLVDEVLIKMTVKKSADIKHNKKAFKTKPFYGKKWLKGCPL